MRKRRKNRKEEIKRGEKKQNQKQKGEKKKKKKGGAKSATGRVVGRASYLASRFSPPRVGDLDLRVGVESEMLHGKSAM